MFDLHCHILPGLDDGSVDLQTSLQMARMAAGDGIGTVACTPHIYPGMYENHADGIRAGVALLQVELEQHGIPLMLVEGADVHLAPDLLARIKAGHVPTIAGSRYLLLEPPHHVAPPHFEDSVFQLLVAGYIPVITHPERLTWIKDNYAIFVRLVNSGAWMQLTAGSLTGRFGSRPRYWAERMLDEGLVHILATDAHDPLRRPPLLAEGREAAARRVGEQAAKDMVLTRPAGVVGNLHPEILPLPARPSPDKAEASLWRRLTGHA